MPNNIFDDSSNIPALALVESGSNPATIATRDIVFSKSDGLYIKLSTGVVIGPFIDAASANSEPVGVVKAYAGSGEPSGYLLCSGQAVSRTTYAALFAVIGTNFGNGNGTTTFNVPDLRGRVAVGLDNLGGAGASRLTGATALGVNGGEQAHTLTTPEIPSHTHDVVGRNSTTGGASFVSVNGSTGSTSSIAAAAAAAGGGGSHNNLQPYLALSYIIKT